ncbi:hypothetical protein Cni_G26623 [Canna indica]|uniref:Uncharacterized protein n=1 Tax=Canna indica TaxID=4628 RepID=A0AAQ3L018_9LILI|nr:hypothetical protein Cni_G26623 [Canna indica]
MGLLSREEHVFGRAGRFATRARFQEKGARSHERGRHRVQQQQLQRLQHRQQHRPRDGDQDRRRRGRPREAHAVEVSGERVHHHEPSARRGLLGRARLSLEPWTQPHHVHLQAHLSADLLFHVVVFFLIILFRSS